MASVRRIQATVTAEDFERIKSIKDELGMTWDEFVVKGAECLARHTDT